MKQKYAVVILFALIVASGLTSFSSYRATERNVAEDMKSALKKTLAQQESDVISTDTIRVFNSYLTKHSWTEWNSLRRPLFHNRSL